jgi:hypothetical protein
MLVIYHSHELSLAPLAALIHMGTLPQWPPEDDGANGLFETIWEAANRSTKGLLVVGTDGAGRTVAAVGRASRPDVTHRAFYGIASAMQVETDRFLLQRVGPAIAWVDIKVSVLGRLGLSHWADRVRAQALRDGWRLACAAVIHAHERADIATGEGP